MPGGFSATATGQNSVGLTWGTTSGIIRYYLTYRLASGVTWTEIARPGGTVDTYDVSGLKCGTAYRFAVKAHGDGQTYSREWGAYSYYNATTDDCSPRPAPEPGPVQPTPTPTPEPPPSPFTAPSNFRYEPSSTTAGQATFYWTAAGNADSHKIEKHEPDLIPFDNDWHPVGNTLGSSVSQVTLSDISTNSVEQYRVTASKSGEDDKHSNVVAVRLKLIPQNLVAERAGHGRAKLTWDPIDSATSYVIQRRSRLLPTEGYSDWPTSSIESGPAQDAATGKITAVVKDLPPGEESRFKVKAKSVHTLSEASVASNLITVTDDRPSRPPTGETWYKTTGFRSIILEWNDDSIGHTGYIVESTPASALVDSTKIVNHPGNKKRLHIDGLPYNERYTFEIYAVNVTSMGALKSEEAAKLTFKIPEPHHWWGHQADHNVKYAYVKDMIGNTFIENAISPAVADWTAKLPAGLAICPATDPACDDKFTVTIVAVNNNNKATGPANENPEEGCGSSRACVKPVGSGSSSEGPGRHMENMHMVFENPPWFADEIRKGVWTHTEYVWTDNKALNFRKVPCNELPAICNMRPTRRYVYVGRVMLHEFGHTLGLPDFYNDDISGLKGLDAVMDRTSNVIKDDDIKQLKAIYRFHSSH